MPNHAPPPPPTNLAVPSDGLRKTKEPSGRIWAFVGPSSLPPVSMWSGGWSRWDRFILRRKRAGAFSQAERRCCGIFRPHARPTPAEEWEFSPVRRPAPTQTSCLLDSPRYASAGPHVAGPGALRGYQRLRRIKSAQACGRTATRSLMPSIAQPPLRSVRNQTIGGRPAAQRDP